MQLLLLPDDVKRMTRGVLWEWEEMRWVMGRQQRARSEAGGDRKCLELEAVASRARGFEAVFSHALRGQLRQDIVQVVWVGVAVTRQVGHHLRLVVDAVPHHRVGLAGGAGRPHGEDEAPHPRHLQQLQHLFKVGRDSSVRGRRRRNELSRLALRRC